MAQRLKSPRPDPQHADALAGDSISEKFRPRTVLLVDDDAEVLALLAETISEFGHRVIQAKDGPDALKCLLKYRSIDCIFSDVVMPNGMSGVQLMTAARAVRPGLPGLLASSYPKEYVCTLGDIPENVEFITKPYLLTDLFALLDQQANLQGPRQGRMAAETTPAAARPAA
jgi:CheY-like chemotaxis protein